jgi:hypothetical protein
LRELVPGFVIPITRAGDHLSAQATELSAQLSRSWRAVGEVNEMQAFSQRGRALCYVQWSDGWRVFAGATSASDLQRIQAELGVVFAEA